MSIYKKTFKLFYFIIIILIFMIALRVSFFKGYEKKLEGNDLYYEFNNDSPQNIVIVRDVNTDANSYLYFIGLFTGHNVYLVNSFFVNLNIICDNTQLIIYHKNPIKYFKNVKAVYVDNAWNAKAEDLVILSNKDASSFNKKCLFKSVGTYCDISITKEDSIILAKKNCQEIYNIIIDFI